MKQISCFNKDNIKELANELALLGGEVYVCIGTDKVFADSLGPRVGKSLNALMTESLFVYGMEGRNITAENLAGSIEFIKQMHPNKKLVVIDSAVGDKEQIGQVQVSNGGITPGSATNKNLPVVGDVSVIGIVAERGMADFYVSNVEKDRLVSRVADFIVSSILLSKSQPSAKV